jgi:hypothetical protein
MRKSALKRKISLASLVINLLAFVLSMTRQERGKRPQGVPYCDTNQRLIGEFTAANHALMELQNQQTQAVIDQDPDFARFDDLIHMAREIKDKAKYALIAHVDDHHC